MHISKERMRLVSREADNVLGMAYSINGDYSLVALLRAIIVNRTEWTTESVSEGSTALVHSVRSDRDMDVAMNAKGYAIIICESKNGYFPSEYSREGWRALDDAPYPISRYLSQFVKTRVFINESCKRVVAAVDRQATSKWLKGFISTLPRILTWYFATDLSAEEQSFFKSISVNNKDVSEAEAVNILVDYVNRAADKLDFRTLSLHKYLDGYAAQIRDSQIQTYRRGIDNTLGNISRYQNELENLYRRLTDDQRMLKTLEDSPEGSSQELFEFFNQHKCIDLMSVSGEVITFGVVETLDFYDEEEFKKMYARKSSYIHNTVSAKEIPMVMNAIFAEHRGSFVTNAVFTLTSMRYIRMQQDLSREDVLPHPHIYFFRCSGGNDQYYSKYADRGEWQLAIEQAIGATKNLNFGDSTVVGKMIRWLDTNRGVRCIKLSDTNEIVTIDEFIQIISKEESQNG